LREAVMQHPSLAPPLNFFAEACRKANVDFVTTFVQFLSEWHGHSGIVYTPRKSLPEPIEKTLEQLNWMEVTTQDLQATQWTITLLNQIEEAWKEGETPLEYLERHRWPLVEEIKQESASENISFANRIAMQVHALVDYLPSIDSPNSLSTIENATLLSAYFRTYGIDYRSLIPFRGDGKEDLEEMENYWRLQGNNQAIQQTMTFETPLSHRIIPEEAPFKPEDQVPGIALEIEDGQQKQTVTLAYDPTTGGLKWPILNGKYLIRFQPNMIELPYRIRLRQARQISYPQSQQVYSYESDLMIAENGKAPFEQTLSMNKVYETWDGYRFYLAGIGHSTDAALKRIQLAVNYDPAKYFLTYPGAFLVFLGAVLLFWGKRR